jgi:four helix bundle protein
LQDFKNLKVWRKAHLLVLEVYKVTTHFPKNELYGITSQIRRACISISANIAEGCCRSSDADFGRFLQMGMGSASELEYLLLLAHDLGLLKTPDHSRLTSEVTDIKRMIASFIQKLKADS